MARGSPLVKPWSNISMAWWKKHAGHRHYKSNTHHVSQFVSINTIKGIPHTNFKACWMCSISWHSTIHDFKHVIPRETVGCFSKRSIQMSPLSFQKLLPCVLRVGFPVEVRPMYLSLSDCVQTTSAASKPSKHWSFLFHLQVAFWATLVSWQGCVIDF